MSRSFLLTLIVLVSLLALPSPSSAESIVSDSCSNGVNLPTTGGNVTTSIQVMSAAVTTSPYTFYVYLNNGVGPNNPISSSERESFYVPTRYFSDGVLVNQTYTPFGTSVWQACPDDDCMRNASSPNTRTGTYAFTFWIPTQRWFTGNITYLNVGSNPLTVQEVISFTIFNPYPSAVNYANLPSLPSGVVGDPQVSNSAAHIPAKTS